MFVAEALLSSLFEIVLEKLMATPLLDYARRIKVDTAVLQEWRRTLLHLQAVLHDAERRQIREEAVKRWLDDLRDLAYDIEDVLDEFDSEARGPQTSTSKVRKLIPSFHTSGVNFNKKMEIIGQELDAIVKRKSDLHLTENAGRVPSLAEQRWTTSFVDKAGVFGRDGDMEKIMELFPSDEVASTDKIQVIPIVGMGGVGKTTLAQKIYNDERVKKHFSLRLWVCVSDQFDVVGTTKAILDDSSNNFATLQSLQERLQEKLNGKRFFLVLDDIWNEDPISWTTLQAPFGAGARGSVVLVTTRHEDVAAIMRTTPSSHHLTKLSDEDCWSVFEHIAFGNMSSDARQILEPIGRKIVKKCNGLPLAATTLAGLLRCQQDEKTWKDMLKNDIWDLPTEKSRILPVLHLSYHYLPTKLKQCFAYCSIFPKDYKFRKEELISLWAAQGLVGSSKRGGMIEDVGELYFENLLSRSFFQRDPRHKSLFVMHDLIHDLAQFVSGEFCFRLEVGKQNHATKLTRHVSYIYEEFEISKKFDPLNEIDKLRTFLPLGKPPHYNLRCYLADKVLYELLPKFKCLRVLSLCYYNITHLPNSFGNLKHLRYLNLSYTKIQKLPISIGKVVNLQWLMLSNCHGLTLLPPEIGKLVNLRHLNISNTKLECMPMGINRLQDLRRLTTFFVGKHGGANITELRDLSHLQGALSILNLQNVENAKDVSVANLKEKEGLDKLTFVWDLNASDTIPTNDQTEVLENLRPHDKLKRLRIQGYQGTECPKWLRNPSFNNLVFLQLRDCEHCRSLPSLGQLQCLEILRFEWMMKWEEWRCGGIEFPCLKELYIKKCPKLKGDMPRRLPLLTKLEISGCRELVSCLPVAPSICELKLNKCKDVVLRSASCLSSLTSLEVSNVCEIPAEWVQLHSLVKLSVYHCRQLEKIPPILHDLTSLKHLEIGNCERLSSLPEMGLPPMLEFLGIGFCPNLESLPEGMMQNNTALQGLYISSCGSLRSLPINMDSLKTLKVFHCKNVELALPKEMMHYSCASLTSLDIRNACDTLTSLALPFFTNLNNLYLRHCENVESLDIPHGIHHLDLTSLKTLEISHCPNMVSFPQGGLPTPNLALLAIVNCRKLKSLPQGMHTLLTSLQSLWISRCPEIVSFPEGGLPPTLSSLFIRNCSKLMASRMEWRLRTLPLLRSLWVGGDKEERLESFLDEQFLPTTLTFLGIRDFPNLKSLDDMGLEHLASLQTLETDNCEKLKSFTKQGLPSSLSCLVMDKCPLLKKRCQRDKGEEWPAISNIPCILLDPCYGLDKEVILS